MVKPIDESTYAYASADPTKCRCGAFRPIGMQACAECIAAAGPVCDSTFSTKACALPAGHEGPYHTSRSGSSWPVEAPPGLTADAYDELCARVKNIFSDLAWSPPVWQPGFCGALVYAYDWQVEEVEKIMVERLPRAGLRFERAHADLPARVSYFITDADAPTSRRVDAPGDFTRIVEPAPISADPYSVGRAKVLLDAIDLRLRPEAVGEVRAERCARDRLESWRKQRAELDAKIARLEAALADASAGANRG